MHEVTETHARIMVPDAIPHPLKNPQNIGFPSNTGPDAFKSHKATKPDSMLGRRHCVVVIEQDTFILA